MPFATIILSLIPHAGTSAETPTYWKDVRPLFKRHCTICHSAKKLAKPELSGGLALDSYEAVIKGSKNRVVIPGKSQDSLLMELVKTDDLDKQMPKGSLPLEPEQIELLAKWIDAGAKEGVRPSSIADPASRRPSGNRRLLDVVLETNIVPPKGVFGSTKPSKLELVLKVGPLPPITSVAFSPDGKQLACGTYGQVAIWSLKTGIPERVLTENIAAVNDLRYSPGGNLLAVAGGQPALHGDVQLFRTEDWQLAETLKGHEDVVFSTAFSPDGKRIASASFDSTIKVWDVTSLKETCVIVSHSDFVYAVAFTPDGKQIVTGSKDRSVKLSDAETGSSLSTISGMAEDVMAVAVSPDGKSIVSGGLEPNVNWWNPKTTKRVRSLSAHRDGVHELCFSNDGKVLASAGADGTVRLWDGGNGKALRSLNVGSVAYAVAISPDAKLVATGSYDGILRLWEVASGRQLASLLSTSNAGWLVATPEGCMHAEPAAKSASAWRMSNQLVSADKVWSAVEKEGLLIQVFRGDKLPKPEFK